MNNTISIGASIVFSTILYFLNLTTHTWMQECIQYSISFQQIGIVFTSCCQTIEVELLSGIKILCTKKCLFFEL